MKEDCTKASSTVYRCIPKDTGAPGEKRVYVACRNNLDSSQTYEITVPFTLVEDNSGPEIGIDISPSYGYEKSIFLISVSFIDAGIPMLGIIKSQIIKDGSIVTSPILNFENYDPFSNLEHYTYKWDSTGQNFGKYEFRVEAKDTLGNPGKGSATFQVLKQDKQFKIYTVAVNYDDMTAYKDEAQRQMQKFKDVSPFNEPGCKDGLSITILDKNCKCSSIEVDACPIETADCVEEMGITDYDFIMAFTDDAACHGYSTPRNYPFALCSSCSASGFVTCASHELGHQFKLCEEYDKQDWKIQDYEWRSVKLLAENPPYSGCGNPYPLNNGIGEPGICDKDCSIDNNPCKKGTCGVKISGTSPPYNTGIMGGHATWKKDDKGNVVGMAANPTEYGTEAYNFILNKIKEGGYCG